MGQKMTLASLPEVITVVDISNILQINVKQARDFTCMHRHNLKPFKVGRENRYFSEDFTNLLKSLQSQSLEKAANH